MKTLILNCRGMKKGSVVRALLIILERIRPDILFLSETHLNKVGAGNVRRRVKFDEMEVYESDGRSGGL